MGYEISLEGKKGLVIGIANSDSIAYGCAKVMKGLGAELAVTYLNEKAESYVRPLAEAMDAPIIRCCDVEREGDLKGLFDELNLRWGRLDFLLHAIAYAPKEDLGGRVTDSSASGFALAMDVSVHSFIRAAKLAEPLMTHGGAMITMSYHGAREVVPQYGIMGPVKAALESVVKYLAVEMGSKGIRVLGLSPGPLRTRAASGIPHFDTLLEQAAQKAPLHVPVTIEDVGFLAALLVSDRARAMTGNIVYVDAGCHIVD
ncbi:MAG: enoyl-[acyl-carrier-protein] reductase FabI [Leptothrix sp. (in: Bacteria)]|nr:enoyl-[acyl-carrier-protein] reductase FabI [Leptothrix sp. (in: b-proteobacteria)]